VNTSVDSTLLSKLGVQYNFSDGASLENDSGDGAVAASLTVDLVQRFNFSVSVDGVITFRSPPANKNGYASLLVFDKAGASTVLAESIFYNLKVRPHTVGHSLAATSNRPLTLLAFSGTARLCSVPRPAGTGVGMLAPPARRCGTSYSAAFLAEAWKSRCTGRAETHNARAASNCNFGDRGQGAVCPGGFRMWPERGYWNDGEVRTLRAKLFIEHP